MRRFRAVAASCAVAALATLGPGAAPVEASTVNVKFGVSAGYWAPTAAACTVQVPSGADGVAVLGAAVAKGCIVSYQVTSTAYGPYLKCVNEICDVADGLVTFWAVFDSSPFPAPYGVGGFRADEGDELTVAYTNWVILMLGL